MLDACQRHWNQTIRFLSRKELNQMIKHNSLEGYTVILTSVDDNNVDESHQIKSDELDKIINSYKDLFPDELPSGLPPKRHVDHAIPLKPMSEYPKQKLYRLSIQETEVLKETIKSLLDKQWIKPSYSPLGAPVLFVTKKDGTPRMVVDYRQLNSITIKDRYPLPRTDDLFDRLQGAKIFSKFDLTSGYHQIQIKPEDTYKTAFQTRYGLYEFKVLPFGLTSASVTFMQLMNDIFQDLLDECVIIYIDDILVYSKDIESHCRHVNEVLKRLRQHRLFIKQAKCEIGKTKLSFLGHIIGAEGLQVDPTKVDTVKNWPTQTNIKEIQSFLGLCNYYR